MKTHQILFILFVLVLVFLVYRKQQEKYGFFDKIKAFFSKKPSISQQVDKFQTELKEDSCEKSWQEEAENRKAAGEFDYLVADAEDPFAGAFEFNEDEFGKYKSECMNRCKVEKFRYMGCEKFRYMGCEM